LERPGGLQSLHPLTKLTLAIGAVTAAAALSRIWQVLAVYALAIVPLAAWSRVARALLRASLRTVWPFLLSLLVVQGFFYPGSRVLFALGPFHFKLEGVAFALLFSTRLLVGLGAALLLLQTTRMDHLMLALTQSGVSGQIAYIVVTALQIIPRFQARGRAIVDAQRARGLRTEGSLPKRARALWYLIPPLLLTSLMETDARAVALDARGFGRPGPKTSWAVLTDSQAQRVLRLGTLVVAVLLIAFRVAGKL
jgi:energy-coupling factor transporter transmembrane protein EcfT